MNRGILKKIGIILAFIVPVILFNCIISIWSIEIGLIPVLGLAGSMVIAAVSGYCLSVWVVLITQSIISIFIDEIIYYSLVNILSIILTVYYFKNGYLKKISGILSYISLCSFLNSIFICIIEIASGRLNEDLFTANKYSEMIGALPLGLVTKSFIIVFTISFVLLALCLLISLVVVRLIPSDVKKIFHEIGWLQKPVSDEELKIISDSDTRTVKISTVFAISLILTCFAVLIVVALEASSLFVNHTKETHKELAVGTSVMAANIIDGDKIDEYIQSGGQSSEYKKVVEELENIRDLSDDIEYIYVYKIMPDGCHVVFDLESENIEAAKPGDVVEFTDSFKDDIPILLEGGQIDPVENADEEYGWLMTSYTPVYNSKGETVCYAGSDVSMKYLSNYTRSFIIRLIIMCSGIIIVIIITGLWTARFRVIYPVDSMVVRARDFKYDSEEARKANVERLTDLDIHTGDEIERLYNSMIQVTKDSMKNFGKMRQKSDYIEQMQSDLIMIIADMVENRDESTGDHIKKTSEYTNIIMKQMKRMGIYSDILTDDYIDNVVKSAPLHDIGKIKIPDAILNKPGKLTKEEFEIMKLHSVYGGEIIDELIESITQASYLETARDIALYHHERWDGTGYPKGLKEKDIPLSARIMAIADVFDALISDRVYKKAFSFEKAMNIIKEESGTHFDPDIVNAFIAASDDVRKTAEKFNSR
ncbi:MAG: HD domain-containing protein [Butyrivibrio sp.]|uniref:HD-GYP domain-containing protein n=1 Tax=Butyrivibrio sp. TaxID=28121 RepID=UPI0025F62FB3|nr:HD domain-containing phosphohydrolase [Butyrivibrio sp.]MCR5772022.1 HD domain-containing protein [Butyrivibrio sp.]